MDILNEFFSYLGYRLNKENDLSDITWALLRASDKFRKLFLEFFFSDMGDRKIKNSIIERERRDDKDNSSRVDLHIFIKNNPLYIIEVKINDKNHHFEQYKKEYEVLPDHFGYITNYELKKDGGYQVRQWETLYDYLLEHINDEDKLIKGYCEYIKQVCGFVKFKGPMRLNSIYNSLFEFIKVGSIN